MSQNPFLTPPGSQPASLRTASSETVQVARPIPVHLGPGSDAISVVLPAAETVPAQDAGLNEKQAPAEQNKNKASLWSRLTRKGGKNETPGNETFNEKARPTTVAPPAAPNAEKRSLKQRFVDSYRKDYCPREAPTVVLPSCPTDKEKYSYMSMNRWPIILGGLLSALSLTAGAWLFIKTEWYFFWYALYAVWTEVYIFMSLGVTIFGKRFDLKGHNQKLRDHPLTVETAPTVDIYLPVCKEPIEVLANTWKHVAAMRYPGLKMQPVVLDDGAQDEVKSLAATFGFRYIVRDDRPLLKKSGNLRNAFNHTSGDYFVVFDADFCPRPDFLEELIPIHLANPKLAIVQTPQFFRAPGEQTWVEQGAGSVQEYFYRLIQPCRNTWGAAICVGSNAVYRREALAAVGGTAAAECSEDVHTGFYAVNRGWELAYAPIVLACGICPDTPRAFFSQQMRWCTGSLSLLTHRDFWKSDLAFKQKLCYLSGMMYYSSVATAAFFNPLPASVLLWTRPELMKYYNLFFALPSLLVGLIVIRAWARSPYTLSVQYTQVIMAYAYLQSFLDRIFGTKLSWVPSGDNKSHKNNRYRNMRVLAWCWTIAHNGLLISASVYRIMGGLAWWQVFPALLLDAFNLFIVHRFLFYVHAKEA
ncbi:unnamed protein product [Zymoseptoria tritici ST99CH_3D7]|uniref:Glycosyltransferase 2-like domain-containing protein n=1 Tax=Zymoseptoria tritici (strain ST99CH_3D7) TaxID=1276538 RepID=A0A1X7RRC4_ZYMT9|nr:unnamed protein product [Zymoseptoria tritici ST99CH_3D7]